jgi:hypothetical protein
MICLRRNSGGKGILKGAQVTPDKLLPPIDNHLWPVDATQLEMAAVVILATRIEVRGKWIFLPRGRPNSYRAR